MDIPWLDLEQLYSEGSGVHTALPLHMLVAESGGEYPSRHLNVTVSLYLIPVMLKRRPLIGGSGVSHITRVKTS